jgi:type I restriction enzyme S subunit
MSRWPAYPAHKDSGVAWLDKIPVHWRTVGLKYVMRLEYGDSLPADEREKGEVPVYGSNGPVGTHTESNTSAPAIVVGRKGSYGKINYSEVPVFSIDTTYYIDPRIAKVDIRWLFYALQLLELDSFSEDSAVPGLSRELVYQKRLPDVPLREQRAIAAFLDRETAKLDALTRKFEQLLNRLEERRAALISHAVTKGLDPDVEMKDSRIPWLGEIPAHWRIGRVKFLANVQRGKFSHRPRNDPDFYNGEYPFIQTGDISSADKYVRDYHQTLNERGFSVSKQFPQGTLVMSIAANIGNLAILDFTACFPDSIVGIVPQDQIKKDFLYYDLLAMEEQMLTLSTQNTQLNLNVEQIGQVQITVPPVSEQYDIATYLDREIAKIDTLADKLHAAIDRLDEYRTALIAAAVTGKIDVRDEVGRTFEVRPTKCVP